MPGPYKPIDLRGITTVPLGERESKVSVDDFGRPWRRGGGVSAFLDSLPRILAADSLRSVIGRVADAARNERPIIMGMGAHVIKVGLNPVVIDLMHRGILSAVAMNGAGIIHDLEIALDGRTSEDVGAGLDNGSFGMVRDTCELLARAINDAAARDDGLGDSVGRLINEDRLPHADRSILAAGHRLGVPVTVHVAMGTDILHMHPGFDPAAAGAASHRDFRTFSSVVAAMAGGVYLNVGSAVILPELFLKAVTLVRNLGHAISDVTTVNMDFIRHYRPMTNVVNRPTAKGGRGFNLVGHHEIMLPLIAAGVIEQLDG